MKSETKANSKKKDAFEKVSEHYFTNNPTSESKEITFSCVVKGIHFDFITASGMFSKSEIDDGAFILATKSPIPKSASILDLGCAWGPVGIIVNHLYPTTKLTLSDVNERAVEYAKKNCKINSVKGKIVVSDGFEKIKEKFDVILFNPPQTAGKKLCLKLIEDCKNHLNPRGYLIIVARAKKGGKSFMQFMEEVYGNVEVVARSKGYHLYKSSI